MVYGGWHPCKGTFSDVWVACFDDIGRNSAFFQQLPADVEAEEPEDSGDEMAFNLVIRRLFRQMEGQEAHEGMRRYEGQMRSGEDEDSDSEEEEDENDESSEDMDGDGAEPPAPEERVLICSDTSLKYFK